MKAPGKLRSRIVLYFCGYLAILLAVYTAALSGMLKLSEDLAFNRQIAEIAARIARHLEEHGKIPASLPMHVSAYPDLSQVPARLQRFVAGHGPGVFEINADRLDYHAALVPNLSTGRMLYVFYDVASIESTERFQSFMTFALGGIGLGVLAMGWLLSRALANRILNPVSELAREVQSLSPDAGPVALQTAITPDEIGTLASTISQLLGRIAEFTRREREFTAHASHELRTPVTVIKGAVELLKSRSDANDARIQRPLARIEHAGKDMEMLIDTFLLLAREGQTPPSDATCHLPTIVQEVVAAYRHLLETKPVAVTVHTEHGGLLPVPCSLVTIALGNLVRNAFQCTLQGKVEIQAFCDRVSVCDSGPGFDSSRRGTGIGLTIVERLSERMNWRFVITGASGEGTRAELIFTSQDT